MRRKKNNPITERVELIGIPHYSQGEADGLCVYYAMAMMIAALRPSHVPTIHDAPRYTWKGSPVFQALKRLYRPEREFKEKIADWFFNGMKMREAATILNRVFETESGKSPPFEYRQVRCRRARRLKYNRQKNQILKKGTVRDVIVALSWHRPVMVAGGGFGRHAVLAVGYNKANGAGEASICFLDPGATRPEWYAPGDIFIGDCEVIIPRAGTFPDYRPMRILTYGRQKPQLETWDEDAAKDERQAFHL